MSNHRLFCENALVSGFAALVYSVHHCLSRPWREPMNRVCRKPGIKESRRKKILNMKKYCFSLLILVSCTSIFAQSNNQFSTQGARLITYIDTLNIDYEGGNISDYSQATINSYAERFSIGIEVPVGLVSNIVSVSLDTNFNYETFINNSEISTEAKGISIAILNSSKNDSPSEHQNMIIATVDEINSSSISNSEKEMLLTSCATLYQSSVSGMANRNETGSTIGVVVGIVVGGIIGMSFCGPFCSFAGSVVFGFIGGLVGGMS